MSEDTTGDLTLQFERGARGAKALQDAADGILTELSGDPEAQAAAAQSAGINAADLEDLRIEVEESDAGFEPTVTLIALKFVGGMSAAAGKVFFDKVVWPKIKKRLGSDALGPPRSE